MSDSRSRYCVFVSHCLLAQGVMAQGMVNRYPAVVRPVLEFCIEHEINIMQMPCPESSCAAGGLLRLPHGKKWYEERGLRQTAQRIATEQVEYMTQLVDHSFVVLAIIGVEFSPACSVNYLNRGRRIILSEGIYVEELKAALARRNLAVPFIGVHHRWPRKLERDLQAIVRRKQTGQAQAGRSKRSKVAAGRN